MRPGALAASLLVLLGAGRSLAIEGYDGLRPLGTGGALRAAASGDVGLLLNPSGMALLRAYSLEAGYQLGAQDSSHAFHAAIVDSTSGYNLAAGLGYTYVHATPDDATRAGHEVRLALAFPFGDKIFLGATGSYLYLTDPQSKQGATLDVGMTVRPFPALAAAVVGYNLRDLDTPEAPRAVGYGLAGALGSDIVLAADGVTRFATSAPGDKDRTSLMGGGEALLARTFSIRAGGGYDGVAERGYASGGLSLVSSDGALDFGLRQDVSGDHKVTTLGVGFRLFVPQP